MRLFGSSAAAEKPAGAYDRVELLDPGGGASQFLTRTQFQALKLDERVRYILGKRLRFYLDGREVPLKDALAD